MSGALALLVASRVGTSLSPAEAQLGRHAGRAEASLCYAALCLSPCQCTFLKKHNLLTFLFRKSIADPASFYTKQTVLI